MITFFGTKKYVILAQNYYYIYIHIKINDIITIV